MQHIRQDKRANTHALCQHAHYANTHALCQHTHYTNTRTMPTRALCQQAGYANTRALCEHARTMPTRAHYANTRALANTCALCQHARTTPTRAYYANTLIISINKMSRHKSFLFCVLKSLQMCMLWHAEYVEQERSYEQNGNYIITARSMRKCSTKPHI